MKKKLITLTLVTTIVMSSMTAMAAPSSTAASTAGSAASGSVVPVTSTPNGSASMSGAEQNAMTYRSPAAISAVAQAYEMTYAEVENNSVSSTDAEIIPKTDLFAVSQGDKIYINGQPSNQRVYLRKLTKKSKLYKNAKANLPEGGKLVSVFNAILPVKDGNTVTTNFYVPRIKGTESLTAQIYTDAGWTNIEIKELRKNHVVLDLTQSAPIRFVLNG